MLRRTAQRTPSGSPSGTGERPYMRRTGIRRECPRALLPAAGEPLTGHWAALCGKRFRGAATTARQRLCHPADSRAERVRTAVSRGRNAPGYRGRFPGTTFRKSAGTGPGPEFHFPFPAPIRGRKGRPASRTRPHPGPVRTRHAHPAHARTGGIPRGSALAASATLPPPLPRDDVYGSFTVRTTLPADGKGRSPSRGRRNGPPTGAGSLGGPAQRLRRGAGGLRPPRPGTETGNGTGTGNRAGKGTRTGNASGRQSPAGVPGGA